MQNHDQTLGHSIWLTDAKHLTIAVMGPSKSGKTKFISLASESSQRVTTPRNTSLPNAITFKVDWHTVTLVEMPSFGDKSDAEALATNAKFWASVQKKGHALCGVIYLHPITEAKMVGSAMRNFKLFRQLCGDAALPNTAIVTTMWDGVGEDVGISRERELQQRDTLFKPALDAGSRMFRHNATAASTREIVRALVHIAPRELQIQRELATKQLPLHKTAAGISLLADFSAKEQRIADEIQDLHDDFDQTGCLGSRNADAEDALSGLHARLDKVLAERSILLGKHRGGMFRRPHKGSA